MLKEYNLEIERSIERIQGGDRIIRNEFIKEHIPFIVKVILSVTGRCVDIKNNDEFAIGLSAFNEAFDSFNAEKHYNFFKFSEQVIKRRIIDYIRSNKKNSKVLPFTYFNLEENYDYEEKYIIQSHTNEYENIEIKQEFILFQQNLEWYGVSINDLILCAPKHRDSKLMCIKIAKVICIYDKVYDKLYKSKRIPTSDIIKIINVSERTIERNRKFIIAVSIILKNDFTILKKYI